jgi:O-antigen/teichoic acid export membrane protein
VESRSLVGFNKQTFKEIFNYAGWGFITTINSRLNNQGVNMLINVFFGVTYNASRGIANQVESAVVHFVNNFTTAFKPQIIKSYAAGDIDGMERLVYRGAKFSYYAMLIMMLPIICETDIILNTWLTVVPDKTVIFVQLSLIIGTFDCLGASCAAACYATGKIKKYAIVLGVIGAIEFPFTWVLFIMGAPIVSAYYLYIFVKTLVLVARIYLLHDLTGLKISDYLKSVMLPILGVTVVAVIPSLTVLYVMDESYVRLAISVITGSLAVALATYFIGLTRREREVIKSKLLSKLK